MWNSSRMKPKFDIVLDRLNKELTGLGIASWFSPKGGYFISLDVLPGTAKRVGELCKAGGVTLTSVGATYPYGIDPQDSNIRIAPSFPPLGPKQSTPQTPFGIYFSAS